MTSVDRIAAGVERWRTLMDQEIASWRGLTDFTAARNRMMYDLRLGGIATRWPGVTYFCDGVQVAGPECRCGRPADMRTVVYGTGETRSACFDCAWTWLNTTSRCHRCGKGREDCAHRRVALDRGIQPWR